MVAPRAAPHCSDRVRDANGFVLGRCLEADALNNVTIDELLVCAQHDELCTVDAVHDLPIIRMTALMRTGSNFFSTFIRTNVPGARVLGTDCESRFHCGAINPFHWKHAIFVPGELYHSQLIVEQKAKINGHIPCAIGHEHWDGFGATIDCLPAAPASAYRPREMRWPTTPSMLRAWDSLLDYRPLYFVVTKNPVTFASSLRSAEFLWHKCGNDTHLSRSGDCPAIGADARAVRYAGQWNDHHSSWLRVWREAPARVLWAPYECVLHDPQAMVDYLHGRVRAPHFAHLPTPRVNLPGANGMSPHGSFEASRVSYGSAESRGGHLAKLPAGFASEFTRTLNYSIVADVDARVFGSRSRTAAVAAAAAAGAKGASGEKQKATAAATSRAAGIDYALALGSEEGCRAFYREHSQAALESRHEALPASSSSRTTAASAPTSAPSPASPSPY